MNLVEMCNSRRDPQLLFQPGNKPNSHLFAVYSNYPYVRWTSPLAEVLFRTSVLLHVANTASGTDGGNLFEAAFKTVLLNGTEVKLSLRKLDVIEKASTKDQPATITFAESGHQRVELTLQRKRATTSTTEQESFDSIKDPLKAWMSLNSCREVNAKGENFIFPCNNFPLVDFMDMQNRGYNFTVGNSHSMRFIKLPKGQPTAQQIETHFDDQCWTEESPLHLVYIAPYTFNASFKTTTAVPASLRNRIQVYVACLSMSELTEMFKRTLATGSQVSESTNPIE